MAQEILTDLETFHDFSCIEINIAGRTYIRAQSINWTDKNDSTDVWGASRTKLGDTPGQYSAEGSFELLLEDFMTFNKSLKSFYDSTYDIHIVYSIGGVATHRVTVPKCRNISRDNSNAVGTDALKVSVSFKSNGQVKVDDLNSVASNQSILGDILRGSGIVEGAIKSF